MWHTYIDLHFIEICIVTVACVCRSYLAQMQFSHHFKYLLFALNLLACDVNWNEHMACARARFATGNGKYRWNVVCENANQNWSVFQAWITWIDGPGNQRSVIESSGQISFLLINNYLMLSWTNTKCRKGTQKYYATYQLSVRCYNTRLVTLVTS
jgi:hypothetical protein